MIFKYYHINIKNIEDYNQTDYTYYNESLNPINKGINCQARDGVYQFICFYLNKYKEVVQMDINPIDNTHYVSVEFQFVKIKNPDDLDSKKTVIMSSLFKNKYKYYYHSINDKFFICMKKKGSFDFSSSSINNIDNFELNQNDGHIYYIFAVFKQNSINYDTLHWNSNNIKAFIRNSDDSEAECYLYNLYSSDLIFIEGINIYFLRTNNKIIEDFEFEYEEKSDNTNTIPIFNEGKENTNTIIIPDTNPNQNTLNEINILKLDKTKEEILKDINTIMKDVNIEETYEYTTKSFNLLIYPINSKLIENKTHIDLSECEYTLKQYYQLPNDSIIAFFQMEISNTNERSLINQVEYQAFDKDKNPLDMSKCNDSNIKILYGIKENSDLDLSVLNSFIFLYFYSRIYF